MGFINKYPYVDFHELNADALIAKVDDAVNTVDGYSARLTSAEGSISTLQGEVETPTTGLLDRVTAAESDIDTLEADVNTPSTGLLDRMTAAEGYISTLQGEVETPTTGLLDRVTALENQPAGGITEYLKFSSAGTPFDYDARITYTYLDGLIATTASADKSINIILVEDNEVGDTWYYTLNDGRYQVSAGTPRGGFVFTCRKPVLDGNNVVIGYNVCTVDVDKNAATPTYSEVYEAVLPSVTSADAGDVLTVDGNGDWVATAPGGGVSGTFVQGGGVNFDFADYVEYSDHILVNIRGTVTSPLNSGATIVTGGPTVDNSSNAVGVLASLNDYNPLCVAYSTNGSIVVRPALNIGETFYISIIVIK